MLALKIIGGIVGIVVAVPVVMFVYFFTQAADDINVFKTHCTLQSDYPLQNKRSYACDDGFTYWKENGIVISAVGPKGSSPRYR